LLQTENLLSRCFHVNLSSLRHFAFNLKNLNCSCGFVIFVSCPGPHKEYNNVRTMEGAVDSPACGDEEGNVSPGTVECFQNFTAPEVFIQGLAGMVNQGDIETIIRSQKYM